jgi:hypothetical protein
MSHHHHHHHQQQQQQQHGCNCKHTHTIVEKGLLLWQPAAPLTALSSTEGGLMAC